jgi:phosphomannomutase/phosphoglucomutase
MISPDIFRKYDIRGIVGDNLTDEAVTLIGYAYASYLKKTFQEEKVLTVTIARDARVSSENFADILAKALIKKGINVVNIGMCPTPLLYFSLFHLNNINGGIMITGSHNPPEYNGFKLCVGKDTLHDKEIFNLYEIISNNELIPDNPQTGNISEYDINSNYIKFMVEKFSHIKSGLNEKIVLDAGNGVAGLVAPKILKELGFNVVELFSEPDGTFPNHHPDPTVEKNLIYLKESVKKEKAILGIGFDGDADRIGAIDENGNIIWGDQLLIIFARDILKSEPGAKIIGEVKCSQILYDDIKKHGGIPIMWKTGHSLIKNKLKEEKAAIAGEMSGHIFFSHRYFGYDDAIYATLRLVEILCKYKKPLSEMLSDLPKTFITEEIRVDCPEDKKFEVPELLKNKILNNNEIAPLIKDIITIDGIRIIFKDGWGLVRASNTQPVLVLRFEADSLEKRDFYRNKIENILKNIIA